MSQRKLRVGMVGGGGPANFFGGPHRRAILMDNSAELTAGALRSKPEESLASARELVHAARISRLGDDDQVGGRAAANRSGSTTSRSSRPTTPISARPTPRPPRGSACSARSR